MSAWSGIRPLATDPDAQDTASASRDHIVSMDTAGMITIAGDLACLLACNVRFCITSDTIVETSQLVQHLWKQP